MEKVNLQLLGGRGASSGAKKDDIPIIYRSKELVDQWQRLIKMYQGYERDLQRALKTGDEEMIKKREGQIYFYKYGGTKNLDLSISDVEKVFRGEIRLKAKKDMTPEDDPKKAPREITSTTYERAVRRKDKDFRNWFRKGLT